MDLRRASDIEDRVIEHVKKRSPYVQNASILHVQKRFLNGALYTVSFEGPADANGNKSSYINRAFVTKDSINVYGHDDDLLRIVGETHSRSFYEFFANGDVVSGIIAVLVTVLIVPSFIASYWTGVEISVPAWITSGWLLILGFYFGKASSRVD